MITKKYTMFWYRRYVWNGKADITLPSSEKDKSENHGYDDDNDSK
jgi:hypothetical protein